MNDKADTKDLEAVQVEVTKLNQVITDLTEKLSNEPASPGRAKSTGGASENMTDC
jgi:hypothetical protein